MNNYYHEIGPEVCNKIKAVAGDGARGFLCFTKKHGKNVLIVLDHFHVKKYLNDAVDHIRKEELQKARKDNDTDQFQILLGISSSAKDIISLIISFTK